MRMKIFKTLLLVILMALLIGTIVFGLGMVARRNVSEVIHAEGAFFG